MMEERLKVIVADDEDLSREGMTTYIPWNNFGLELVGSAKDGEEALELLERTKAQILVTDIEMPKMDGLQLIKEVDSRKLKVVCIVISAYNKFEYAQQAMRYKMVCDYILKPLDIRSFCDKLKCISQTWKSIYIDSEIFQVLQSDFQHISREEDEQFQKILLKLTTLVRRGLADEALEFISTMPLSTSKNPDLDFKTALRTAYELTLRIEWMLAEMGYDRSACGNMLRKIALLETEEQVREYCINVVEKALNVVCPGGVRRQSSFVRTCLQIISEQYADPDFSLPLLAGRLLASPHYVSSRLKLESGLSFIKALNQVRIDRAKELLRDPTQRIYEICDKIGIRDPRYFARLFKEYTGVTPSEYRDSL